MNSTSAGTSRRRHLGQVIRWNTHVAGERKLVAERMSVEVGSRDGECKNAEKLADGAASALQKCSSGGSINVLQLQMAAEAWVTNVTGLEHARLNLERARKAHQTALSEYQYQQRKVTALEDLDRQRMKAERRSVSDRQARALEEGVARARWLNAE